jgi:hypothetical protein
MSKKSKHQDQPYEEHYAVAPDGPQPPPEPTPEERARDLLATMTHSLRHNSPVTPLMVAEVSHLIGHISGQQVPALLHHILDGRGHAEPISVRKPDGVIELIDTAEEALVYVRSLPVDVQARPHWRAADRALSEALTYVEGGDISPAVRIFQSAVDRDREDERREVEVPPRDKSLDPPTQEPYRDPGPPAENVTGGQFA